MMMSSRSSATPCPVPNSLSHLLNTNLDETTTTIDFTTELRASFRNARPRRIRNQPMQFHIHEDQDEKRSGASNSRVSLLQPPRRMKALENDASTVKRVHIAPTSDVENTGREHSNDHSHTSSLGQAPKRPAARLSSLPESAIKDKSTQYVLPASAALRPARRGTIFIPNDDTTMPSMYMGIFSPIKDMDLRPSSDDKPGPQLELTGIAAQMAMKRTGRKSILGGQVRRGTLQPSLRIVQETAYAQDRHGQGGGKENVPPNATEKEKVVQHPTTTISRTSVKRSSLLQHSATSLDRSIIDAPPASSVLKREPTKGRSHHVLQNKPTWNGGTKVRQVEPALSVQTSKPAPWPYVLPAPPKPRVPTRFVVPVISTQPASQNYAILRADIVNPALYEEDWLQHQEIVITQLINNLFSTYKSDTHRGNGLLRDMLLNFYNSSAVLLMHSRLQTALLYGALGIPQDTLEQGARLQNDIGMKKRFTDLWLYTYNHSALESALEVVIGRECRPHNVHMSVTSSTYSKNSKFGLRNFIETFLIRNEDAKLDANKTDHAAWIYRKTVLRSLMLVKVLDSIKSERPVIFKGDLFQHSSSFKSSIEVLQAVIQILNPAAGNVIRNLGHINYHVTHVQHPLQEFDYHIENIAVDIRDGARLARLVELLLYPSCSRSLDKSSDSETTTIIMPEGETLEFSDGQDWPLSRHIKMPCQSRTVRLWNVQLALSAINAVKGMNSLVAGITAEDIVDGFREKTIKLLWALVGKCGLTNLIDWKDLRWEIRRQENKSSFLLPEDFHEDDFDEDEYSFEACKRLLKRWAQAVTRSKDIEIHNFTTSFADGKAFDAIVSEYETFLHVGPGEQMSKKASLRDRLNRLGCSNQFADLFAEPRQTHIFDRDFVLAALAFLCSRLLAPSRRSRAATLIQQAWRKHWSGIEVKRKEEKRRTAMACAGSLQSRKESQATRSSRLEPTIATSKLSPSHYQGSIPLISTGNPTSPISEADIWLTL